MREFDAAFTAPHFGFASAEDYYHRASAMRVIDRISVPALVITPEDDPFVPTAPFRDPTLTGNPHIRLFMTPHGGHCGFLGSRRQRITTGIGPNGASCSSRLTSAGSGPLVDCADAERILVGTSGYNYPEWRGTFYPGEVQHRQDARLLCRALSDVEINYTFYRIPNEKLLAGWSAGTPDGFSFTLKAPRRITHDSKLQRCEDLVQSFCRTARTLGPKLGVLLFQLPPTFKKDIAVLRGFVSCCPTAPAPRSSSATPRGTTPSLRHAAQPQPGALRRRQREDEHAGRDDRRLRILPAARRRLSTGRRRTMGGHIGALAGVSDAFVYFKHEEQGLGPDFAKRLITALRTTTPATEIPGDVETRPSPKRIPIPIPRSPSPASTSRVTGNPLSDCEHSPEPTVWSRET